MWNPLSYAGQFDTKYGCARPILTDIYVKTTPTRVDAEEHRGFRGPGGRPPGNEARLASNSYADAQEKDISSDRRDLPWSSDAMLIDTVARLQRDLNDMRAVPKSSDAGSPGCFAAIQTSDIYVN